MVAHELAEIVTTEVATPLSKSLLEVVVAACSDGFVVTAAGFSAASFIRRSSDPPRFRLGRRTSRAFLCCFEATVVERTGVDGADEDDGPLA